MKGSHGAHGEQRIIVSHWSLEFIVNSEPDDNRTTND